MPQALGLPHSSSGYTDIRQSAESVQGAVYQSSELLSDGV